MARRTSLYQAPRSPLIQGRTRWERPLWQPWLGGAVVSAAAVLVWFLVLDLIGGAAGRNGVYPLTVWLAGVGLVVGSGLGCLVGRSLGWRQRWLASAMLGVLGFLVALALMALLHLPAFYPAGTG